CSGQHTSLAKEPLEWFGITPDDEVMITPEPRTLSSLTGELLPPMERMVGKYRPDIIIAQGDTTTLMITALTAFYLGIPFGHVEAGLRTGDFRAPFPEEFNRVVADRLAQWHFCPTMRAAANLKAEGVNPARVFMTGNTGIDSLRIALEKTEVCAATNHAFRRILLTTHRRENQGIRMEAICRAIRCIVSEFEDV